ncbi:hypothetical protein DOY81_006947 [Sarcophaga bullata]|nr:hypothetical protein DOY81_006947 [Sarcophaga bullata]
MILFYLLQQLYTKIRNYNDFMCIILSRKRKQNVFHSSDYNIFP